MQRNTRDRPDGQRGVVRVLLALALGLAACEAGEPQSAQAASRKLAATGYKVVLIAGDPSIAAFDNATARLSELLVRRGQVKPDDISRFSARDSVVRQGAGLATAENVLAGIAALKPARGQGCLVFATSHGSPGEGLDLPRSPERPSLLPGELDSALLRGCGGAPTVVVLSGCFSGEYLRGALRRANRVVLTAARADRPSFGCGAGDRYTFFDDCLLEALDAAANTATWQTAFAATRICVTRREGGEFRPSEPQAWFGAAVAMLLLPWRL